MLQTTALEKEGRTCQEFHIFVLRTYLRFLKLVIHVFVVLQSLEYLNRLSWLSVPNSNNHSLMFHHVKCFECLMLKRFQLWDILGSQNRDIQRIKDFKYKVILFSFSSSFCHLANRSVVKCGLNVVNL